MAAIGSEGIPEGACRSTQGFLRKYVPFFDQGCFEVLQICGLEQAVN